MGNRVSLFVTCMVDQLFPKVGMAMADVLERLGYAIDFPEEQTCCGQPAYNSGYHAEARTVARHFLRSEEYTSELQSPMHLVCRLLLEKISPVPSGRWAAKAGWISTTDWSWSDYVCSGNAFTSLKCSIIFFKRSVPPGDLPSSPIWRSSQ